MSNPFEKYLEASGRQNANYAYLAEGLPQMRSTLVNAVPTDSETSTSKSGGDILNDAAIATAKTIVGVPQALVGLADLAGYGFESAISDAPVEYTGYLGKAFENAGFRFKDAQDAISTGYSDAYKTQQARLHKKGEFNLDDGLFSQNNADVLAAKAAYVADNPALAVNTTLESLGYMLAGGALGTAAKAGASSLAARAAAMRVGAVEGAAAGSIAGTAGAVGGRVAGGLAGAVRTPTTTALAAAEKGIMDSVGKRVALGALGEAEISAGILQENIRNQTEGGLTSPEQSNLAAVGGAGVGLLGYGFGRLANRAGAADIDTALIRSSTPTTVAGYLKNNPITRVGKGELIEGLEEVPQENLENFVENLATDKGEGNILHGAADSTVLGFGAGALMGGGTSSQ